MAEPHVILSQTQYNRLASKKDSVGLNTDNQPGTDVNVNNNTKLSGSQDNKTANLNKPKTFKKPVKKSTVKETNIKQKGKKSKKLHYYNTDHDNENKRKIVTNEYLIDKLTPPGVKIKRSFNIQKPRSKIKKKHLLKKWLSLP